MLSSHVPSLRVCRSRSGPPLSVCVQTPAGHRWTPSSARVISSVRHCRSDQWRSMAHRVKRNLGFEFRQMVLSFLHFGSLLPSSVRGHMGSSSPYRQIALQSPAGQSDDATRSRGNSGSRRFARRACGLAIGASTCCCAGRVGRSMPRRRVVFTRSWLCSCGTKHRKDE